MEAITQGVAWLASQKRVKRWIEEGAARLIETEVTESEPTESESIESKPRRPLRASSRIQGGEFIELSISLDIHELERLSGEAWLNAQGQGAQGQDAQGQDAQGQDATRSNKISKRTRYWDQVHCAAISRWSSRVNASAPITELERDDHFIAVLKESGLPTAPTIDPARDSVYHQVYAHLSRSGEESSRPYLRVTHRLDRDTSGVVIMSCHPSANRALGGAFERRLAHKRYWLVCARPTLGRLADYVQIMTSSASSRAPRFDELSALIAWSVDQDSKYTPMSDPLVIEAPIGRVAGLKGDQWRARLNRDRALELRDERDARTSLYLLALTPDTLLIEARPHTGRTHQIRAHLNALEAPLLGDVLYRGQPAPRLMLHARHLRLPHPHTQDLINLYAPLPHSWRVVGETR